MVTAHPCRPEPCSDQDDEQSAAPLVSILIPAFKPHWFKETLDSALAQDYPNLEILVFDNCPTEAIAAICRGESNIVYYRNPNRGARNTIDLVTASKGRYVKFLFDDDLLAPDCVTRMVEAIRRHPGTKLAFASSWAIDERGNELGVRQGFQAEQAFQLLDGSSLCRHIARTCTNIVGEFSSVLLDGAWLRDSPDSVFHHSRIDDHFVGLGDVMCFIRAAAGHPVAFIRTPLTSFRINSESNSNPDKNPHFIDAVTEWRAAIAEVNQFGILSEADLSAAKNAYNNLAMGIARNHPGLADSLYASLYADSENPHHAAYLESRTMLVQGKQDEALALLLSLAEKETSCWQVYESLADFALAQGDHQLARTYLEAARGKFAPVGTATLKLAKLLIRESSLEQAVPLLTAYLAQFPDDGEARNLLEGCTSRKTAPRPPPALPTAPDGPPARYERWMSRHALTEADVHHFAARTRQFWKTHPVFEFVLIARQGDEAALADTIDSVASQFLDAWRLSIVAEFQPPDNTPLDLPGLTWATIERGAEAAAEVNRLLEASDASWMIFIDPGTVIEPHLLLACGDHIALHPECRLLYADDDLADVDGRRFAPQFKPDFNLEYLRSMDYVRNIVVERAALLAVGGFSALAGAENYDAVLRVRDRCGDQAIGHVADVLLHIPTERFGQSREIPAREALRGHLGRCAVEAEILDGPVAGTRRLLYGHGEAPPVSIVIPTKNQPALIRACIDSLLAQTNYPDWEILIVDNGSDDPQVLDYYRRICQFSPERLRLLRYPGPFNYAAINNFAARQARGDYLLLLNNDTEAIHDDWLIAMMGQALRPDVGIVGARLLYPHDLTIQHAGVVLGLDGGAGHPFVGALGNEEAGYMHRAAVAQELSAVTAACLLTRKSLYFEVDGLDEQAFAVCYNDVDYCLKVRARGQRIIWTPFATLLHHGSATQNEAYREKQAGSEAAHRLQMERERLLSRWLPAIAADPAWNRNLSLVSTSPMVEDELVVPWHPEIRDCPRILGMPLHSVGQAEYRVFAPLRALYAAGLAQCSAVCQPQPGRDRAPTPIELARLRPDAVMMHAPIDDVRLHALTQYARLNPDVLRIYALDDLITNIPPDNPAYRALPADIVRERLRIGLAASDRAVVSTDPLAELCRQLIDDVRVIPNTLDANLWNPHQSLRRAGSRLRVGWAGAQAHKADLEFLMEVLRATCREVDWVFFGMLPDGARPYVAEFHEFVHGFADYPARLASLNLDLAVAPLVQNAFNEAKSNLRLLEYGILGWPVICTDILPYRTGNPPVTRLPNDSRAWIAAIRERAADRAALAAEGDALQSWVRSGYLLENHLDRWLSALTR